MKQHVKCFFILTLLVAAFGTPITSKTFAGGNTAEKITLD